MTTSPLIANPKETRRGNPEPSFDELIDARFNRYVATVRDEVLGDIEQLRERVERIEPLARELPAALDRHQIAFHLSCSPSTADMLIRTGKMQAVQLPGMAARVVLREEFLRFLAAGE